jgi:multisubunit Na+/H+ antiporter MnhG subunit
MVNWKDPDLEAKLEVLSVQLLYAVLGLYGWEYIRSSHVEVALIRRQLQFRWPLLSYISARFGFLIAVILSAMQSSPFRTNVDCQSITFAIVFLTNLAIGCSTTNLMIRTWLIWNTSYLLRILLVLLSLGHWTLLTLFLATARASTMNGVCVMNFVNPTYASAVVIYVMLYDLALLVFTVIGLLRMPSSSTLWKKLVKQGVVYFILNFAANLILLALNRLNYNPMMDTIFAMPAACIWSGLSLRLPVQTHDPLSSVARSHLTKWSSRLSVLHPIMKVTALRRLKCLL